MDKTWKRKGKQYEGKQFSPLLANYGAMKYKISESKHWAGEEFQGQAVLWEKKSFPQTSVLLASKRGDRKIRQLTRKCAVSTRMKKTFHWGLACSGRLKVSHLWLAFMVMNCQFL